MAEKTLTQLELNIALLWKFSDAQVLSVYDVFYGQTHTHFYLFLPQHAQLDTDLLKTYLL